MAYPNNLRKTSIPSRLDDSATVFFNNYLQPGFTVSSQINDTIIAHFEKITDNRASAEIMASAVIYTSLAQRIDPLSIIDKMKTMEQDDVSAYITMFLNLNRVGSSYLGTHKSPNINKYVKRGISPDSGRYFDGSSAKRAAPNALHIKNITGTDVNGNYWIRGYNDIPMMVYCDMNGSESGSAVGGWMRFDHSLVSAYRNTAITDKLKNYVYANNGAYNISVPANSVIRGIRWDLGPTVKFSGVRVHQFKLNNVNGQDGWAGVDAPTPTWIGARPTDNEVVSFFENSYVMGNGSNQACFGVSAGNGNPGPLNLARLYRGRASSTEWPDQFNGIVTLTAGSFLQHDTRISNGRFIYFYESDDISEYNNIQQYRIWLR